MDKYHDPDADKISDIIQKEILNQSIQFTCKIGNNHIPIDNCNIIGDCLENVLFHFVSNKIKTFTKGPKQSSPDFYNNKKQYEWELKGFKDKPGFDVSNFTSYINQLSDGGVKRKLFQTKYIVMKYSLSDGVAKIKDSKICTVWNIVRYIGTYPI